MEYQRKGSKCKLDNLLSTTATGRSMTEAYSEPSQTSNMACSLAISDLRSETKGSHLESGH